MRRHAHEVRFEMTPLLDVVFLLLTFFIYAMVVMVRADALPVGLSPVEGGGLPSAPPEHVLNVELDGSLTYNRAAIDESGLQRLLADLAADPASPTLYVALRRADPTATGPNEPLPTSGGGDRGPVLWSLMQTIERAGLTRVVMVGSER